jgi:glycosyltransferase involved in cell wall biosynthesis
MTSLPGLSVVIPAYNYGHCLARAVRSAAGQDDPCFQVLVIDDGSTDDTAEVVTVLHEEGWNFEYQYQPNAGVSAVRNRGVREAAYEWLIFLDADDELLPGALRQFRNALEGDPGARLIIAGHESVLPDESVRPVRPPRMHGAGVGNLSLFLDKEVSIANGACALHRDVFSAIEYRSDLRHTEDLPVFAHALAHYPVTTTPEPVARIHKHGDSRRHDAQAAVALGMRLENIIFDESDLPPEAQRLRRDYRSRRALSLLKLCYRSGDYAHAVSYFMRAFRVRPLRALAPRYLRRFLVSLWKR